MQTITHLNESLVRLIRKNSQYISNQCQGQNDVIIGHVGQTFTKDFDPDFDARNCDIPVQEKETKATPAIHFKLRWMCIRRSTSTLLCLFEVSSQKVC
jgi:hypothetical protein